MGDGSGLRGPSRSRPDHRTSTPVGGRAGLAADNRNPAADRLAGRRCGARPDCRFRLARLYERQWRRRVPLAALAIRLRCPPFVANENCCHRSGNRRVAGSVRSATRPRPARIPGGIVGGRTGATGRVGARSLGSGRSRAGRLAETIDGSRHHVEEVVVYRNVDVAALPPAGVERLRARRIGLDRLGKPIDRAVAFSTLPICRPIAAWPHHAIREHQPRNGARAGNSDWKSRPRRPPTPGME